MTHDAPGVAQEVRRSVDNGSREEWATCTCGVRYRRTREGRKYCSDSCRNAAWIAGHPRQGPRQKALPLEPPTAPRTGALRSFHVRSHVTVREAIEGERRAQTQDEAVLAWMRAHPGRWTPPEVLAGLEIAAPLTSIRRSLTNLAKAERLQHWPAVRRPGVYGALNSTWEAR